MKASLGGFVMSSLTLVAAGCGTSAEARRRAGLAVIDGRLHRDGQVYRGIGVNYCDLFQEMIRNPDEGRTLKGLKFLGEKKVPFVRFWCGGFWPINWDLYFEDKDEWFRRLDLVVKTAEDAGVGLIPSLFWRTRTYPDLVDEYSDQWANPDSKTREFMARYTREVVTRYKDSPAIWGWEFANEMNLVCNLPKGMNSLGRNIPHLKVNVEKHERNLMTYEIAGAAWSAFAREVRKIDPHRFITTGNSCPRQCAWHHVKEGIWKQDDRSQAFEAFRWMSPPPMNVVSIHFYPKHGRGPVYAEARGIEAVVARYREFSDRLGQPLFIGEFRPSPRKKGGTLTMAQFREQQTKILDAMLNQKVDLAAYWVFDFQRDTAGLGLVRRDNEYAWVLDQIVEYNARIREQLAGERKGGS